MTADLRLRVVTSGDTRGLDRTADALDDTGKQAEEAAVAFEGLGHEAGSAARKTDELGDQMRQTGRAADSMKRQILEAEAALKLLARRYAESGEASVKADVKKADSALRELKRIDKILNPGGGAAGGAGGGASTFASFLQGGILKALLTPQGAAIGGAGLALGSIPIGAMAGGLTLGAAGLGAAGLAGFAASKADQSGKLAGAGKGLLSDLNSQLLAGGKDAIGPLLNGINQIRAVTKDIHLDEMIRTGAKYIEPLAAGAAQFARFVAQAAQKLTSAAGPVIQVIADELPDLGRAFASFADDIAGGSGGGAKALKDLLNVIEAVIIGTGRFIGYAEDAYGAIRDFGNGILTATDGWGKFVPGLNGALVLLKAFGQTADDATTKVAHTLPTASTAATSTATSFTLLNMAVYNTADAAKTLDSAWRSLIGETLSLDQANLAAEAGFANVQKTIKANKGALDEHSAAGIADRQAILAQVQVLEQQREAAIAAGDGTLEGTRKANGAFLQQLQRLRDVAAAAHADTTELDKMLAKYKALANAPDITKSITFKTTYRTNGVPQQGHARYPGNDFAYGGIRRAATGMIVPPSNPGTILMGEPQTRGEALIPLSGSRSRAMSLAQTVGDAHGFDVVPRGNAGSQTLTFAGDTSSGLAIVLRYLFNNNLIQLRDADGRPVRVA